MDWVPEHLAIPRHLSSRLWLITLPSAVVSFEKRSDMPQLPKAGRVLGIVLAGAGVALGFMALRPPDTTLAYDGPLAPVGREPAGLASSQGPSRPPALRTEVMNPSPTGPTGSTSFAKTGSSVMWVKPRI